MRCEGMLVGTALVLLTAPARAAPPVAPPAELPPPVRDDWIFGIDASVGPLPGLGKDVGGGALAARFGYRVNSRRAFITPEAVLGLVVIARDFGGDFLHGESAWFGAGARAGLRLGRLEPALFAHGYIRFVGGAGNDLSQEQGGGGGAPALDVGGVVDVRLSRSVALGVHSAFVFTSPTGVFNFGTLGLHVDIMR